MFCVSASCRWSICLSFRMMWRITGSVCIRLDVFHTHTHIRLQNSRFCHRDNVRWKLSSSDFFHCCEVHFVQLAVRSDMSGGGGGFVFLCPCLCLCLQIPLTYEGNLASGSHEARPLLHNICGPWARTCDTLTPCCCPFLEILS